MTFKTGESGNPNGRPKGAFSRRVQLSKLLEPHAEELINKAVEMAKSGEPNALRLCLERLIPRVKDETIFFELPQGNLVKTETLLHFGARVIEAVAEGTLTPDQGQKLTTIIEAQRKTIELACLEARVIEHTLKNRRINHD
jgi:hypothetical protein